MSTIKQIWKWYDFIRGWWVDNNAFVIFLVIEMETSWLQKLKGI